MMSKRYGGERVKRGLLQFALGKVVSAISGFLAMVLVVRLLPVQEFAHYSVLVSLVEIFMAFSAFGLSHALIRFVPELYAQHYKIALKDFVFGAFVIRTALLALMVIASFLLAEPITAIFGMGSFIAGFKLYLWVVVLRTTLFFLSQVLESTLHQGVTQLAFSLSSILRLAGMVYLARMSHTASLQDVIWVEIYSDLIGLAVMSWGVVDVTIHTIQERTEPPDDSHWLRSNFRQIMKLAMTGYAQHIAGLPFGSNTNRLVGGYLFTSPTMASFGFAQSFYEYMKRYLPAQLLIGLIRPVIVARFSDRHDFPAAARTSERVVLLNMMIIGSIFAPLAVSGVPLFHWISAGKYGEDALWVLMALIWVLALETNRLILEMLAQTVQRYAILIPSNLLLALSVLPAIAMYPYWGAVGFPLVNGAALLISNFWVRTRLAKEGYKTRHNWVDFGLLLIVVVVSVLTGVVFLRLGVHWLAVMLLVVLLYLGGVWKLFGQDMRMLKEDLVGRGNDELTSHDVKDREVVKERSEKMKVKILSMQRVVNYGSFMQAYALKRVVESFGHQVSFSDFRNGEPRHAGVKVKKVTFLDKLWNLRNLVFHSVSYLGYKNFRRQLRSTYQEHAALHLGLPEEMDYDYHADLMIIGSDEVFNYTQNHAFGYVPALFGHGVTSTSIISYAASAGYANVYDVLADGMQSEISSGLNRFDAVGVRDKNTYEIVKRYSEKNPVYVVDPTLLYGFKDETTVSPVSPGYLLIYAYGGRFETSVDVNKVLNFAHDRGLRVISVGFYNEWCDENIVVSPFELLAVFKNASYVITDTFHGTIFSIKNHKQFISILQGNNIWGSNSSKLGFLLKQLKLESRINHGLENLESHLETPIDYVVVDQNIARLREESMRFLTESLRQAQIKAGGRVA